MSIRIWSSIISSTSYLICIHYVYILFLLINFLFTKIPAIPLVIPKSVNLSYWIPTFLIYHYCTYPGQSIRSLVWNLLPAFWTSTIPLNVQDIYIPICTYPVPLIVSCVTPTFNVSYTCNNKFTLDRKWNYNVEIQFKLILIYKWLYLYLKFFSDKIPTINSEF